MKELYKNYKTKFEKAAAIAEKYGLNDISEKIGKYISAIDDFRVTVPLVGKFSTGKSSLLNAMLGMELLSTNITPETAVPAEIIYGNDTVEYISENGTVSGGLDDLKSKKVSVDTTKLVRIGLKNDFLSQLPNVKIVDMPGFDSGIELHNKAIDEYLPKSLAYIITVSGDESTIHESVINFLNELKLNNMPVYTVLTKFDKVVPDDRDKLAAHIRSVVEKHLGIDDPKLIITSADEEEGIDELKAIFLEIQAQSDDIFRKNYSEKLNAVCGDISGYLATLLKKSDSTSDELQADIEALEEGMKKLDEEYFRERERFESQLDGCVESIKSKVASALSGSSSTLENMLLQDMDISEKVNLIVRTTITAEINRQLDGKVKRYIENVSELINSNMMTMQQAKDLIPADVAADNENMRNSLQKLVNPVTTIATTIATTALTSTLSGTAIGALLGSLLTPVGVIVGVAAGAIFSGFINSRMREKEEAQRRNAAREQVSHLIRDVIENAGGQIAAFIYKLKDDVNAELEKIIEEKGALQKKALEDAKNRLALNNEEKQNRYNEITADLSEIETIVREVI